MTLRDAILEYLRISPVPRATPEIAKGVSPEGVGRYMNVTSSVRHELIRMERDGVVRRVGTKDCYRGGLPSTVWERT